MRALLIVALLSAAPGLAMAGDYRVRFDMRETVPFVADYTLCDATGCTALGARLPAGAGEVVRLQPCPGAADNGGG